MKKEIEHFRHGGEVVVSEEEWSDGLAALMAENRRLKYQLQHLQKVSSIPIKLLTELTKCER